MTTPASKTKSGPSEALLAQAADVASILRGEHGAPFAVLGPHVTGAGEQRSVSIRVHHPRAREVEVVIAGKAPVAAVRVHEAGFFEAGFGVRTAASAANADVAARLPAYRLRLTLHDGSVAEQHDPYAFPALLTEYDLHLMGEGTHYEKYEKLGAHVREVNGVRGVHFGVWAPNARRVSVVGNFNGWDGRVHPMRKCGTGGVWELFLPGLGEGEIYKYEILTAQGPILKADPYGFYAELRPSTGSRVFDLDQYQWQDAEWVAAREKRDWLHAPISIYEAHLGSWRRKGEGHTELLTYRELADELIPYVAEMGYTHIELMPVMEHPYDGSWGYQTLGYFAATCRYGTPADLMHFIDRAHQAGIGVILDWTPAHFPRDAHGLAAFDGTHLYEHADPRQGAHPDWGTLVFNYGRNEVQNFLISNALFWMDKYHADGLRVDAVASMLYLDYSRKPGEWIPNQYGGRENLEAIAFLRHLNEVAHARHPGVLMVAEESTSWPMVSRPTYVGGLGFSLKWNMGWMHDTLDYFKADPIFRKFNHNRVTFSMIYAFSENFLLPFSHDEVVHLKRSMLGKMPGNYEQQFANLRLLYAYQHAHPGKKLMFMGGEIAQWDEWNHETQLDWVLLNFAAHRGVQQLVKDLNRLYAAEKALHELEFDWTGFEWMDCNDADNSVLSFVRKSKPQPAAVAAPPEEVRAEAEPNEATPAPTTAEPQTRQADFAPLACAPELMLVVCNFTPVMREGYIVAVPEPGFYREVLNTDSEHYGGGNVGNQGGVHAEPIPHLGKPYSLRLTLPPLSALYFKLQRQTD